MNTKLYLKRAGFRALAVVLISMALTSCDSTIYDYEGDCSVNYKVRFKYDYNMKYADAFSHEVSQVTLYLADSLGNIVWQKSESGSALAEEGYMMDVDVTPGRYQLLAWCGTQDVEAYSVASADEITSLQATLNLSLSEEGRKYIDTDLGYWFHGYLDVQDFPDEPGTYYYTVPLVKDTNIFRIVLQHVTGDDVDVKKFTFQIDDDNELLDWDNTVLPSDSLTYFAWHTDQGSAEVYTDGTIESGPSEVKSRATFAAAIAELTTSRLVTSHKPRLTVKNTETEKTVFSIPLIDYALLVKGFYNQNMDDQEYLDRQDEWDMVFFLDEGDRWVDTYIYINSWKIVLQSASL